MPEISNSVWAKHALTKEGWQSAVRIDVNETGHIAQISANQKPAGVCVGIVLPAMANLHSHAFQRAMAGMTETRGPDPKDSFWSWRKLMYKFLQHLSPDDAESIAAFAQMEMLESGYSSVGEFHYLHHQADGTAYTNPSEMSERIVAASRESGIGLTLLPVLYEQGGCDGRALSGGQKRFGHTIDAFANLFSDASTLMVNHHPSASIGIAPHSLRAVSRRSLNEAHTLAAGKPLHIHIAEQEAEVQEILDAWNVRPVDWLLENCAVDQSWCLVHATQMTAHETTALAQSGAVAGLCPITESNLGDGIFNGDEYRKHGGTWGVGTDSNIRIALSEELRTLEYSQRLRDKSRAIYANEKHSTARVLFDEAQRGGAQALQRNSGAIEIGRLADLMALDLASPSFIAVENDGWLDAWIFANDDRLVTDVWSAGNHVVKNSQHIHRERITACYRKTMSALHTLL